MVNTAAYFAYTQLLNKPFENEVTLREQNPSLKQCKALKLLTYFEIRLRSFNTIYMKSLDQKAAKLPSVKV